MATVLAISGSPSTVSRTDAVITHVADEVRAAGHDTRVLLVRDLPAAPLLAGDAADPAIASAADTLAAADGVIVATPVYKAAYSGVLKSFLDLLPQFALTGKVVLPLATGGSPAHVLAVDYAMRPVLASLGAEHITQGWFVLASQVDEGPDGLVVGESAQGLLGPVVEGFLRALSRRGHA